MIRLIDGDAQRVRAATAAGPRAVAAPQATTSPADLWRLVGRVAGGGLHPPAPTDSGRDRQRRGGIGSTAAVARPQTDGTVEEENAELRRRIRELEEEIIDADPTALLH